MSIKELEKGNLDTIFRKGILFSFLVHLLVILGLTMNFVFFPDEDIIIPDAIRVDIVDLPDKIENVKKLAPKPKKKKAIKKKPKKKKKKPAPKKKENLKKIKEDQQKAFDKLNAMESLDKITQEMEEDDKPQPEPTKKQEFKGAALSKGSSLTGLDKLQFDEYFTNLQNHVRQHWNLPEWLANANISSDVVVYLDDVGNVVRVEIARTSGNTVFDDTTLTAIRRASPFPEPPARLKSRLTSNGIQFTFP